MAPTTRSQTSSLPSTPSSVRSTNSNPQTLSPSTSRSPQSKPVLAILGTGWSGFTLLQRLSKSSLPKTHDILVLSPNRTMALTPLLASAACGIFDFRVAEEPVRRSGMMKRVPGSGSGDGIQKYQVWVEAVDFDARTLTCRPAVGSNGNERESTGGGAGGTFEVSFDKLVIAPGSEVNTFDTPGVAEHCLFMKSVSDAMALREKVFDCFELASLPKFSAEQKRDILHFIIVGGGPMGVELAAELDELVNGHLLQIYPECRGLVSISVYDVADRMLGQFGEKLSEYAMEKFRRREVNVRMGKHVEGFEKGFMSVKEDGRVGFGIAVWAAGNKTCGLVEEMHGVMKDDKGMLVTDQYLRVLADGKEGEVVDGVWALGDAAGVQDDSLPATAEVAVQKAEWLANYLVAVSKSEFEDGENNKTSHFPRAGFEYKQKALVAYIGRKDGIVDGSGKWTGKGAWLAWRGGSLQWSRSWRRKAMMLVYWVLNKWDGREIARR
ncbi:external NADH-ubiquinone oxidoreductase 2 [Diplocarpon rosae]|nr:external NADH-ubiquinone oxidoreductase 2 [Diplocarpon rosae]